MDMVSLRCVFSCGLSAEMATAWRMTCCRSYMHMISPPVCVSMWRLIWDLFPVLNSHFLQEWCFLVLCVVMCFSISRFCGHLKSQCGHSYSLACIFICCVRLFLVCPWWVSTGKSQFVGKKIQKGWKLIVLCQFFRNRYTGVSPHKKLMSDKVCFIILGMSFVG